jgi:probable HAF family extracellular repeat protein
MTDLGTLGARLMNHAEAKAINNQGIVVGWSENRAVIFRQGVAKDLNQLVAKPVGYMLVDAVDVNDAGQIIGNALTPAGTTHAFLLNPDKKRPSIQVQGPGERVSGKSRAVVNGLAADNLSVNHIEYQIGNGRFRKAVGKRKWRFEAALSQGRNRIRVRAVDGAGNLSRTSTLTLIRS